MLQDIITIIQAIFFIVVSLIVIPCLIFIILSIPFIVYKILGGKYCPSIINEIATIFLGHQLLCLNKLEIKFDRKLLLKCSNLKSEDIFKILEAAKILSDESSSPLEDMSDNNKIHELHLATGRIVYNPPPMMKVGSKEYVEARISGDITDELTKGIKGQFQSRDIKVSESMTVELKGDNFKIVSLTSSQEMVINQPYTQWEWEVTPLKIGTYVLSIIVDAIIFLPNRPGQKTHIETLNEKIVVKVNPQFMISNFLENNWQYILTTIIAIIVAAIAYLAYLKPK